MADDGKTVGDHVLVILFLLLVLLVGWTYWFRSRPRTSEVDFEVCIGIIVLGVGGLASKKRLNASSMLASVGLHITFWL
jgi:hypothetical protein